MQKLNTSTNHSAGVVNSGKPTMPILGRQPMIDRKFLDPSSSFPRGERYPIPSFFEYRSKPRDFDVK